MSCTGFYCLNDAQQFGAIFCIVTTVVILALVYWYVVLRKRPYHRSDPEWEIELTHHREPEPPPSVELPRCNRSRRRNTKVTTRIRRKRHPPPTPRDVRSELGETRSQRGSTPDQEATIPTKPPAFTGHQVSGLPPIAQQPLMIPPPPPPLLGHPGVHPYHGALYPGFPGPVMYPPWPTAGGGYIPMTGHHGNPHPPPPPPGLAPAFVPPTPAFHGNLPVNQPRAHRPEAHQPRPADSPKRSLWSRLTGTMQHPPPGRASTVPSTPSSQTSQANHLSRPLSAKQPMRSDSIVGAVGTSQRAGSPKTGVDQIPRPDQRESDEDNISAVEPMSARELHEQGATPKPPASPGDQQASPTRESPRKRVSDGAESRSRLRDGRHDSLYKSPRSRTPSDVPSNEGHAPGREDGRTIGQRLMRLMPQVLRSGNSLAGEQRAQDHSSVRHRRRSSESRVGSRDYHGGERRTKRDERRMNYENRHSAYRHDGVVPKGQDAQLRPPPAMDPNKPESPSDMEVQSDVGTYRSCSSGMIAQAGSACSDMEPTGSEERRAQTQLGVERQSPGRS